jgi:predicted MFS family arabinose efflux permease
MTHASGLAAAAPAAGRSLAGPAAMLAFATAVVVTTEFIVVGLLPAMTRDLDIGMVEAGRFVSWFALASALLGPPLTIAASRAPPRRVVAAALCVFALGNVAATLPSYPMILAVRVVQGATLPVLVSVGSVALADLAGPGREGRAVALVYLGVVVALVLAVPAGVIVAEHGGWRLSFLCLALLAAVAAALVGTGFPRLTTAAPASIATQAQIMRQPMVQAHLALSALLFAAMFAAYSYLAAFLETVAGFDGERIAVALMGFGGAGVLGNWIAGRVVDRGPTAASAGVALVLMLAMAAVSLAGGSLALLLPLLAVWGAAHTATFLLCQVRVMLAAPGAPAFAASLNIAACNLGIAAGAAAGGWVAAGHGIAAVGHAGAALAAGALALAIALARRSAQCRRNPSRC